DELANRGGIRVERPEAKALVGRGRIAGEEVILAKPQTYMNLSSISVRELLEKYELDVRDLLVLWDEAQLQLGTIRIHPDGSAGREVETILPGCVPGVNGKRSSWKSVITIWFLSCGRRRRKTRSRKSSRSSSTPARKKAARSRRPSTGAHASSRIAWPSTAKVSTFTRKSAPRMVS